MQAVYDAAGGQEGMLRLAAARHARVLEDEVVSHAFSHGYHHEHTERLAAYWAEAWVVRYVKPRSMVMKPPWFGYIAVTDRTRTWIDEPSPVFDQALADMGLTTDERQRQVLHDYFSGATHNTMARYHNSDNDVPDGLQMLHWSWDGPVGQISNDRD